MTSYLFLLNKIAANNFRQKEINFIVENSVKIASFYVNHEFKKIGKIVLAENVETEDIALESISPLFETNGKGMFSKLIDAFRRWDPPVKTESDAMFFMNRIIASRVNQHIAYLLKTSDPVFSKILDSVNYYTRKNGFHKINYFGSVYIAESSDLDIREKILSYEELGTIPFYIFLKNKDILRTLFKYLKDETDFYPAIPLNALVVRLKSFYLSDLAIKNHENNLQTKYESVELIKIGLKRASEKLELSYVKKGKLNNIEKKAFQNTLTLIAEDLGNGGVNPGLYKYLNIYMKDLTKSEYDAKYHHMLEYLLKVMKLTIAQKIKN